MTYLTNDITGIKFNNLTTIRRTEEKNKDGRTLWECKCDCGNTVFVAAKSLKSGNTKSCGCRKWRKALDHDLVGQAFGKLKVISRGDTPAWYKCKCSCGNERLARSSELLNGTVKSCGCLFWEVLHEKNSKVGTHHMTKTRLYRIWYGMRMRCTFTKNRDYMNYGGRGIKYCDQWKHFEPFMEWAFAHGYEEHLTLERVDVNGNYEPDNCKWITGKEQYYNKTTNRYIEHNGEKKTVAQWAKEIGISRQGLRYRLEAGWTINQMLSEKNQGQDRSGSVNAVEEQLNINGCQKTIKEWARENGISNQDILRRIKLGWMGEDLLLPIGSKRRKK